MLTRAWDGVMRDAGVGGCAGQCGRAAQACVAGSCALDAPAVPGDVEEREAVVAQRLSSPPARRAAIAQRLVTVCVMPPISLHR